MLPLCQFQEPSLYTVKAIFILDNDGQRLLAKYYDGTFPSTKEQKSFERSVFTKTHKTDSEIAFLEGLTIVYKSSIDLFFYVVGSSQENELMLVAVLTCLFDSLNHMLRAEDNPVAPRVRRVILESDPQQVIQKVNFRVDVSPLSEQSVAQVFLSRLVHMSLGAESVSPCTNYLLAQGRVLQSAKEQIKWSLLK
nr:coatomer subunit zeta-2 [Pelodiscus sinensis]|eukprot:XP_006120545.1 coatomer subunit zeta-2 [Pelodiscus sinensis]